VGLVTKCFCYCIKNAFAKGARAKVEEHVFPSGSTPAIASWLKA